MVIKKDAYYFPHDSNARNDERILCLRADFGNEGYGIYWILIEMMHESTDSKLSHKMIKGHAHQLNIQEGLLMSLVSFSIDINLFVTDTEKYWSERVMKNKQERDAKYYKLSLIRSEAGKKGADSKWNKEAENQGVNGKPMADVWQTDGKNDFANGKPMAKDGQRKGKKRKEVVIAPPPTLEEVKEYFLSNDYPVGLAEKAFKYYEANKWKDSKGNVVQNWKQKMIAVWFKEENKRQYQSQDRSPNSYI